MQRKSWSSRSNIDACRCRDHDRQPRSAIADQHSNSSIWADMGFLGSQKKIDCILTFKTKTTPRRTSTSGGNGPCFWAPDNKQPGIKGHEKKKVGLGFWARNNRTTARQRGPRGKTGLVLGSRLTTASQTDKR